MLADGGVIAPVGIHVVALAAKKHSIPFVVLVGLHKLSPLFPHDPDLSYNGESLDGLALKALPSTGHSFPYHRTQKRVANPTLVTSFNLQA